jgi:hypothetical protein
MADLGDFSPDRTTDPHAAPDTFTFGGEQFNIPATVGAGALLRFTWRLKAASEQQRRGTAALKKAITAEGKAQARELIGTGELDGSAAIYDLILSVLGEDQIDAFTALADRHGVTIDGLLDVCHRIQEAIAGRPTRQPTGSSDGLPTSGTGSTASGSGVTDPAPVSPLVAQRALVDQMTAPAPEAAASYI